MSNIIEVKNLVKSYGDIKAVDDISFVVKKGSLFAFVGLNGAGKSTTVKMLCSIAKKDRGVVKINGFDLDSDYAKVKQEIGVVFQNSVLDDRLSVIDNLKSRGSLYSLSNEELKIRIDELSVVLGFKDLLKRPYGKLSGGQKRRIDIARALISRPNILFLDEPTTGLDPNTRLKLWEVLKDLVSKEKLTIFLTTHYMEEVDKSSYVVIIDEGKIIAQDTPDNLKNKYTSDFIRIIDKKNPAIDEFLLANNKEYEYINNSYYIKASTTKEALQFVFQNQELITDFEILKGDMDSVFVNVTGKKLEDSNTND